MAVPVAKRERIAMTHHNKNDFFNRAEFFLLRLCLFILLLLSLARFVWSEAAPFLSEVFRHFKARQSQTNARAPSYVVNDSLEQYNGFLIAGSAVPDFAIRFDWYSQGIVLRPGRLSSIVEVKRIEGPIFNSKEAAEQHGLELCRDWIDERLCQP